jgi:hypothetical protein
MNNKNINNYIKTKMNFNKTHIYAGKNASLAVT